MILACAQCGARSASVPTALLARVAMSGCGKCGSHDIDFADEIEKTASPVIVDPEGFTYRRLLGEGWTPGRPYPRVGGAPGVLMIPPGETDDQRDLLGAVPDGMPMAASKTASDDIGPNSGGVRGVIHALVEHFKSGDHDKIPSWVPKHFLTDEEIKTGRWIDAGGLESAFASATTEHSFLDDAPRSEAWAGADDSKHAAEADGGEHAGPKSECPLCQSNGALQREATGNVVHVRFDPKGKAPQQFLQEELGTVSVEYLDDIGGGIWDGAIIVPDALVPEAEQLGRAAVLKKAAWGIFNSDDHKMVYGPTTKEAIEMALDSGRYASGYYVGTLPDHPGTEWAPPPEIDRTDPFTNTFERGPFSAKRAKIDEIVEGVLATNSSLALEDAQRIALAAVQRYPGLVATRDVVADCTNCGKPINRGKGIGERMWRHIHSGSGICDSGRACADPKAPLSTPMRGGR